MNKQLVVLTTSDLENMHKIQLNMLIEFDKICRRNNIKYILDAGSDFNVQKYICTNRFKKYKKM